MADCGFRMRPNGDPVKCGSRCALFVEPENECSIYLGCIAHVKQVKILKEVTQSNDEQQSPEPLREERAFNTPYTVR